MEFGLSAKDFTKHKKSAGFGYENEPKCLSGFYRFFRSSSRCGTGQ